MSFLSSKCLSLVVSFFALILAANSVLADYTSMESLPSWLDTKAGNSLVEDATLFDVVSFDGVDVIRAASHGTNIHSHFMGANVAAASCEYSGRMYSGVTPNMGVTFASDYPNKDAYYRLRVYNGGNFELNFHGKSKKSPVGNLDSGVASETNTWFRFRVRWESRAEATYIRAKVWNAAASEPNHWQIHAEDFDSKRYSGCRVGLWSMKSSGSQYWDELSLTEETSIGDYAAVPGEGLEAHPTLWFDTYNNNGNPLFPANNAFGVIEDSYGDLVHSSFSDSEDIHNHFIAPFNSGSACSFSGAMEMPEANTQIGVTVASGYPNTDRYYGLIRDNTNNAFHLISRDPASSLSGVLDTALTPLAGQSYQFKIQWEDLGASTQINAKVWKSNQTEPVDWLISAVDDNPNRYFSCRVGLWSSGSVGSRWNQLSTQPVDDGGEQPSNLAPSISSMPITTGSEGSNYSYTVEATDPENDTLSYTLNGPDGMSIDDNGLVTWEPDYNTAGNYSVTVTATDPGGATDQQSYTLYITNINQPPVVQSLNLSTLEDQSVMGTVDASDPDGDTLSYTLVAGPVNGVVSSEFPQVFYQPNTDYFGTDQFTVSISDGTDTVDMTVGLTVTEVNDAPIITSSPLLSINENAGYEYAVLAIDAENTPLTFELDSAPDGMSISLMSGVISWVPDFSAAGVYPVVVIVSDGQLTSSQEYTITVQNVNLAPVTEDQTITTQEDTPVEFVLTGLDFDNDDLQYFVVEGPSKGTLSGVPPNLIYTPLNNVSGDDVLKYKANDGSLDSSESNIFISIVGVNEAPKLESTPLTVTKELENYLYQAVASDPDLDALEYSLEHQPNGMQIDALSGEISWVPSSEHVQSVKDQNSQCYVLSSGSVKIYEEGDEENALPVLVEQLGIPDLRVGNIELIEGEDGFHLLSVELSNRGVTDVVDSSFSVQFFNGHPEMEQLLGEIELTDLKSGQTKFPTITVHDDVLTDDLYVRLSDIEAIDECLIDNNQTQGALVRVRVSDPHGENDTQVFVLNVEDQNSAPILTSAAPEELQGGQSFDYQITTHDEDIGDAHEFVLVSGPDGLFLDSRTGRFYSAPNGIDVGEYEVVVEITDLGGEAIIHTFSLTVYKNLPPQIISKPITKGNEKSGYAYTIEAHDPNLGDVLEYSLEQSPVGLDIDPVSGQITGYNTDLVENMIEENRFCRAQSDFELGGFQPVQKWHWGARQVLSLPVVSPLYDTNSDSIIDQLDDIYIIANGFKGGVDSGFSHLFFLDGKTGEIVDRVDEYSFRASASVAVGDVNADGKPEIIAYLHNGNIIALDNGGEVLWINDEVANNDDYYNYGAINIADINGDGQSEILAREFVLDSNGQILWQANQDFIWNRTSSFAVDVDFDGFQEVFIAGYMYSHDGTPLQTFGNGYSQLAIANFDEDDYPEIVEVRNGKVSLFNHDGTVVWTDAVIPDGGYGSPTIGDMDGDGKPEIGVAGRYNFVVFDTDGSVIWSYPIEDHSSQTTGSTVFDFDGDGDVEVIYGDEKKLRIFDGRTGLVEYSIVNISATAAEYPVVADVDSDGRAEIVVVSDSVPTYGLRVFEDINDSWVDTRRLWNQYHYHVDNINDDLSIPSSPIPSWLTHNSFRINRFPTKDPLSLPDLTVTDIKYDMATETVSALVTNRGLASMSDSFSVRFIHKSSSVGEQEVGVVLVDSLNAGEEIELALSVESMNIDNELGVEIITSEGAECISDNNSAGASIVEVKVQDGQGLADFQKFALTMSNVNSAPRIVSTATSSVSFNQVYSFQVEVLDPDKGDDFIFRLVDAPNGFEIDQYSGIISGVDLQNQSYSFLVEVEDLLGATDQQLHVVFVSPPDNSPPVISDIPSVSVILGEYFELQAQATDVDGDPILFSLSRSQPGMSIDSTTGLIHWLPSSTDVGVKTAEVLAIDSKGAQDKEYFLISVVEPDTSDNQAPFITSVPSGSVYVGSVFEYQVIATDPDGDPLTYHLQNGNGDMSISETGLLSWLPSPLLSGQSVIVDIVVEDEFGASVIQTLTLPVNESANTPPIIINSPGQLAHVGVPYEYHVQAEDPDGDAFTITVLNMPPGMEFAGSTLKWIPTIEQSGEAFFITVEVLDARGAKSALQYGLNVQYAAADNHLPVISSTPSAPAFADIQYEYQLVAFDEDADDLNYSLDSAPAGMHIDQNGLLSWTPSSTDIGDHVIRIRVADPYGWRSQQYNLPVVEFVDNNNYPNITSLPSTEGYADGSYTYQVVASDADGDALSLGLIDAPDGMQIDAQGLVTWIPGLEQVGIHDIVLFADDGKGKTLQSYSIVVTNEAQPLSLTLLATPDHVDLEDTIQITLYVSGGQGDINQQLFVDGTPLVLNSYGQSSWVASVGGVHEISAIATDDVGSVTEKTFVAIRNPSDKVAPAVTLISPEQGETHSEHAAVIASVTDDNLAFYQVFYAPVGSGNWVKVNEDYMTVEQAQVALIDTTLLTNGQYDLMVYAEDVNGLFAYDYTQILVEGDLKVGHMNFTVRDLSIPMEGVPINVSRTYDSRRRNEKLSFGYGWSIDYQDVKIEENFEPTTGWYRESVYRNFSVNSSSVSFRATCMRSNSPRIVTVTLPNGDVEKFQARLFSGSGGIVAANDKDCQLIAAKFYNVVFDPIDNTQSELEAIGAYNLYYASSTGNLAFDIIETSAVDLDEYKLTLKNGYIYYLDQNFGVRRIETPNGHAITYNYNGIIHSSGKSVTFQRDAQGRIEKIIDPAGNELIYTYDGQGDLRYVQDQALLETPALDYWEYTYQDHYLEDMIDPLGRKLVKNLYDDEGRLYAQENSDGVIKTFDHDLDSKTSIVTDLDGRSTHYAYDGRGNVLTESQLIYDGSYSSDIVTTYTYDDNDNQETRTIGTSTWTSQYDADDNLTYAEDPEGHRVNYLAYNDFGQETQIQDELGRLTVMDYDTSGNLETIHMPTVTDPDTGEVQNLTANNVINAYGLVESTTDLRGYTTGYVYYPEGHVNAFQKWKEYDAGTGQVLMTYTYDTNNNVKTETRTRTVNGTEINETLEYDYDARNRLTHTHYPDSSYTQTDYDLAGNVDKERDRFGEWTDYTYDVYGRLTNTVYPDGSSEQRTYTNEGLLETVTDRMGRTTTSVYDDAGRLWKTVFHDGSETETRYTPQGWVQYEWDEEDNLTEYEYDKAGRRKAVIRYLDGVPLRHEYEYYDNGELHTETDALLRTTTYVINELDQRIETQFHNGTHIKHRYDPMGARTKMIDQRNVLTDYRYDERGRLWQVQPDVYFNNVRVPNTEYSYDEVGNKLTQTDANGHATTWTYDYFGRVLTRELPEGQMESFVYNDSQRSQTHTDFNGVVTITYFDVMGRVSHIEYQLNGEMEHFTYWNNDQVKTVTDQHGTTEYYYDARDRLDYQVQPDGTVLDYSYDNVGNRTEVKLSHNGNDHLTTYHYDDLNRLQSVIDSNGTTSYSYDDVGNLDTLTYPNGIVLDYDYNSVNQLDLLTIRNGVGVIVQSYDYGLNETGRRDTITEANGRFTQYQYDDLYRLTDEQITDAVNGNYSASYLYDWVGNRDYSTVQGVQTDYVYDANDRLQSQGGTTYAYDNNGNLKTETLDGNITAYYYDHKQKMVSVEYNGSETASYQYDYTGIRTAKSANAQTTHYIVDANRDYAQVLLESTGADAVQYSYGHDLISQKRSGAVSYYHYDGLGSTRALSDATGTITDSYHYEAFGEIVAQEGTTENGYLFTGEQFDASLDQYYLRARYYDQGVGRFTQMDSWTGNSQDPITLHKYLYANVDPANMIDPTGKFSLASIEAANSIRAELTMMQINVGYSLLDAYFNPDMTAADYAQNIATGFAVGKGLAMLGSAGTKLLGMLSNKFRSACNSFDGDTLVATENGSVPISKIKIGDLVWSYNETSGESSLQEVVHLIRGEGAKELIEIYLSNGEEIIATEGHPFYVKEINEWIAAGDLDDSDSLYSLDGDIFEIDSTVARSDIVKVYNLTVSNNHTFYVGSSRILSHNSSACNPFGPFPNQMSGSLQAEIATARSLNVRAINAGSSQFDELINSGETVKWAVSTAGELKFIPASKYGTEISHAVIHGGDDVIAAGEASIVSLGGGRYVAVQFSNKSGHYRPSPNSIVTGGTAFKKHGIEVPGSSIEIIQ